MVEAGLVGFEALEEEGDAVLGFVVDDFGHFGGFCVVGYGVVLCWIVVGGEGGVWCLFAWIVRLYISAIGDAPSCVSLWPQPPQHGYNNGCV